MNGLGKWTAALAVFLFSVAGARTDEAPKPPRQASGRMARLGIIVLNQEPVQRDLKLSESQLGKVRDFTTRFREAYRALERLGPDERRKKLEELTKACEQFIRDALSSDQVTRLYQILLQYAGPLAFASELADQLRFTDEQKKKLADIRDRGQEEIRKYMNDGHREDYQNYAAKVRKQALEEFLGILTDGQKKEWKEIIGPPFQGEIRGVLPTDDGPFRRRDR